MGHNLEIKDGEGQMFSVRQVPWHKLGRIVDQAPNAEEAIKLAGLNWKVEEKQIYTYEQSSNLHQSVPNYKALVRSDNGRSLAVMKNSYSPLQNEDAFKFFNPFVESGLASFETAGSLLNGKVVWILATLNKAPIDVGGGDIVNKHLLLSNSHDGTMAIRVGFTPVRVVCNNTLKGSHSHAESRLLRIKHTGRVTDRLDQIQQVVNAMDAKFEATAEQYRALTKRSINKKDLEAYVNVLFELRPLGSERDQSRAKKIQEQITKLFENGAGQHLKSAKGTWWGAYNAITEHLTHNAGKEEESRLYGNWFGTYSRKNEEALKEALKAV